MDGAARPHGLGEFGVGPRQTNASETQVEDDVKTRARKQFGQVRLQLAPSNPSSPRVKLILERHQRRQLEGVTKGATGGWHCAHEIATNELSPLLLRRADDLAHFRLS